MPRTTDPVTSPHATIPLARETYHQVCGFIAQLPRVVVAGAAGAGAGAGTAAVGALADGTDVEREPDPEPLGVETPGSAGTGTYR
jgi:hypothetical protein